MLWFLFWGRTNGQPQQRLFPPVTGHLKKEDLDLALSRRDHSLQQIFKLWSKFRRLCTKTKHVCEVWIWSANSAEREVRRNWSRFEPAAKVPAIAKIKNKCRFRPTAGPFSSHLNWFFNFRNFRFHCTILFGPLHVRWVNLHFRKPEWILTVLTLKSFIQWIESAITGHSFGSGLDPRQGRPGLIPAARDKARADLNT